MNKKGFTLIELLVTIALIAVIAIAVGISVNSMLSRRKDEDIKEFKNKINKAACTCAEVVGQEHANEKCNTVDKLIDNGYLSKDMKDPETGKTIDNERATKIKITQPNGEFICTGE